MEIIRHRVNIHRATFADYNAGKFFITIDTSDRNKYSGPFGYIKDEVMYLNTFGKRIDHDLNNVEQFYSYIHIPEKIVMPNHIHLLIVIEGQEIPDEVVLRIKELSNPNYRWKGMELPIVSKYINSFKGTMKKFADDIGLCSFEWEKNYWDHILRSVEDLNNVVHYIRGNVLNVGRGKNPFPAPWYRL